MLTIVGWASRLVGGHVDRRLTCAGGDGEQDKRDQMPHQSTPCIRRFRKYEPASSTPPIAAATQPMVVNTPA